ncbi:sec1-binding region of mso1 domain-containing protein [Sarocladium implicatum]|nr:sec1-binding region of mso1 domain-containing protein [Sarocladium implicatum]
MASWYSNILTKTSSQISNLRTTLLSSEADGDTEDDTHVCRVLRDYYTEKGRPFPQWLPPDPKAPPPTQPVYAQSSASQVGARYGGMGQAGAAGGQQGGLSSLWGDGGGQQQQAPAPQSLRAGRAPAAMQQRGGRDDVLARPLPSQRSGSYQTAGTNSSPAAAPVGGASSAQDRLRQRFRGGGNSRGSSPSQGSQSPFQPPAGAAGYDAGGGGGGGAGDSTYVSANAPWSTGEDPYAGGGGGYQRPPPPGPARRQGLPSGPRGYR